MKGRQTRHSKVYTSRGPRDRRVRLSALTAIQFYDVQDRLGYDRPGEAVDWLMLKAKASIEALPQKPNVVTPYSAGVAFGKNQDLANSDQEKLQHLGFDSVNNSPCFPTEPLSLLSTDYIHMPEFNYELGNDAASPFPVVGSQLESVMLQEQTATRPDCEFVPSSCLDQVVFSASLFSKQTSAIASSMEDGPRKHRVLDWPFMTPPSVGLRSSFQIGE